jgi:hypothetical protein
MAQCRRTSCSKLYQYFVVRLGWGMYHSLTFIPVFEKLMRLCFFQLLPVLYGAGLALLPRQFMQERNARFVALGDESHVELYVQESEPYRDEVGSNRR